MSKYVNITIEEMRRFLRPEKGWVEVEGWEQYVFECPIRFWHNGFLRIFTTIRKRDGYCRNLGKDSIKVCVIQKNGDKVTGIFSTPVVLRVAGWRDNLKDRVVSAMKRASHHPAKPLLPPLNHNRARENNAMNNENDRPRSTRQSFRPEDKPKQVGAVITFPPGVTKAEAESTLRRIAAVFDSCDVREFNPAYGQPVFYIP